LRALRKVAMTALLAHSVARALQRHLLPVDFLHRLALLAVKPRRVTVIHDPAASNNTGSGTTRCGLLHSLLALHVWLAVCSCQHSLLAICLEAAYYTRQAVAVWHYKHVLSPTNNACKGVVKKGVYEKVEDFPVNVSLMSAHLARYSRKAVTMDTTSPSRLSNLI
jgi:hypothetical protein